MNVYHSFTFIAFSPAYAAANDGDDLLSSLLHGFLCLLLHHAHTHTDQAEGLSSQSSLTKSAVSNDPRDVWDDGHRSKRHTEQASRIKEASPV